MNAQAFFEEVKFLGALSNEVDKDWTQGWTEFNPKQANYPAVTDNTTLNGEATGKKEITADLTLNASTVYLLKGIIVVKSGVTLTIPAGTVIRGEADLNASPKNYATLVVERGGKLVVNGTSSNPVVFTSSKAAGSRERGDWGGIVLCGNARNNQGSDVQVEGFNNVSFDNQLAKFGGTNDDDNSGSLTYLRIEFAGLAFEPNKEVNSITFGSVGKATKVEGIQCSFGNDDAFEWFGGNVNGKYLIAYKTTDDDFDTDFGFGGAVQFGIAVKDTAYYDLSYNAPSGASTSETFESDNDASGSGKTPYTRPVFSNITCIGPVSIGSNYAALSSVQKAAFRRGARIRRNSRISIINSVFMGYRNFIMIDGDSCIKSVGIADSVFNFGANGQVVANNLFVNTAAAFSPASATANGLVEVSSGSLLSKTNNWLRAAANSNKIDPVAYTTGTVLVDPQNPTAPNYKPVAGSPVLTGANFGYERINEYGKYNSTSALASANAVTVYPNPATTQLNVELDMAVSTQVTVKLVDLSGRTVAENAQVALGVGINSIEMPLHEVGNGMYLLVIENAQGKITKQIIVNQ